jgi:iron complex outermembrane receptor protein
LRASFQKAVRAPNIVELFSPNGLSLYNNDADPCAGDKPSASAANCARTGVTAAQYGKIQDSPAGQYNQFTGGNPNLLPEESKSKTFGVVFTPMKNLSMSIDYFNIKVEDTIGGVSAVTILNKCLSSGDAKWCSLVQRDRLGTLWLLPEAKITAATQNIGSLGTSGIDLNASYLHKLDGYGSLGISMSGTLLKTYEVEEIIGDGSYDCVGYYNNAAKCGQPRPKWRHKVRANWNTPWNVDVAMTWRHFGSSDLEGTSSNPLLKAPVQPVESHFNAVNYLDLAASWNINKTLTLTGGINNVLDKDPPLTSKYGQGVGNGNTFPSMYDAFGRKLFINLSAKFN